MQTYIVRIYRMRPEDEGSVSGMLEDIESGHKDIFNSLTNLQSKLSHSIEKRQIELDEFAAQ